MKNLIICSLVMATLSVFVLGGTAYGIEKKCKEISYVKKAEMKNVKVIFVVCDAHYLPGEMRESRLTSKTYEAIELMPEACYIVDKNDREVKHFTRYVNNYKSVYLNHRHSNKAGRQIRQYVS